MGLIRLTQENVLKRHFGGRNQEYRWINDVEYTYGTNGRLKEKLHVVIYEETSRDYWQVRITQRMDDNFTKVQRPS